MFVCDLCKKQTKPGEKLVRVVTQTRSKVYPERFEVDPITGGRGRQIDKGGLGVEIVKEAKACPACAPKQEVA